MAWSDYGVEPFDAYRTNEFKFVWDLYNGFNTVARRSQVPKIHHIIEGIAILEHVNASNEAIKAFCLHPLLQMDDDFNNNVGKMKFVCPVAVALAVEYRSCANSYLCKPETDDIEPEDMPAIPSPHVQQMLLADKVQNMKDFMLYHYSTHPRSFELRKYFINWLTHLGYTNEDFLDLSEICISATNNIRSKLDRNIKSSTVRL